MIEARKDYWCGKIQTALGKTWFKVIQGGPGTPVIMLHGGPGSTHESLEPLEDLSNERTMIFYDQLGGGRSDPPADISRLSIEYFVDELEILRRELKLARMHLLGVSWGAALGVEYALAHPDQVASLVLSSPFLSTRLWIEDALALKRSMGPLWNEIVERHEAAGTTTSKEYEDAKNEYRKLYVCRTSTLPVPMARAMAGFSPEVYWHMWGPAEFTSTGVLKDYDCLSRLTRLQAPTLYLCGRYDEARPSTVQRFHQLTAGSRMHVFENSAHFCHLEEPDAFLETVRGFWRSLAAS